MKTYILKTDRGEFYCGKTTDIDKRMKDHKKALNGSWFEFNERKNFKIIKIFDEDIERKIKSFGVEKFVRCLVS